jgi:hypothetical protein
VGVGDAQPHPSKPRARRPRRNSRQKLSVSASPTSRPITSRRPLWWDAVGDHQGAMLDPPAGPHALDLGVQPQLRVDTLQGPLPEDADLLVQAAA